MSRTSQTVAAALPAVDYSAHAERVAAVAAQVLARPEGSQLSIRKQTGHHQAHDMSYKERCHRIDVSGLSNILGLEWTVDTRTPLPAGQAPAPVLVAVCEGQITMKELCAYTLPLGYVPEVVPEFPNFTVAGLINGEGIQTSCFRFGAFSHTLVAVEVVLGDGRVIEASTTQHRDLFSVLPEAMGSLGIVTLGRVMLRPCRPQVVTRYELFGDADAFVARFSALVRAQAGDFLEGLAVGPSAFLVVHSVMADEGEDVSAFVGQGSATGEAKEATAPISAAVLPKHFPRPFSTDGDEFYYRYLRFYVLKGLDVRNKAPYSGARLVIPADAIPLDEFLFRSVRGGWWVAEMHVNNDWLMGQRWLRKIIDKKAAPTLTTVGFAAPKSAYLTRADEERCVVLQDMGINLPRLGEGLRFVTERLGVYPLWICPLRTHRGLLSTALDEFVVDMGLYGEPTVQPFYSQRVLSELQALVDFPSAWGMAYNDEHMPESKREAMRIRDRCRIEYGAVSVFPSVKDKCAIGAGKTTPGLAPADGGPIPHWRRVRDYGPHWRAKFTTAAVCACLVVAIVLPKVFPRHFFAQVS